MTSKKKIVINKQFDKQAEAAFNARCKKEFNDDLKAGKSFVSARDLELLRKLGIVD